MLYPQTPRPIAPYSFRNIRPYVSGGPVWSPQSRALTVFGLLECDLSYRGRSAADMVALWKFYDDVQGAAGRFTFIDFNGIGVPGGSDPGIAWPSLFVAQGDGVTTTWDLPCYATKSSLTQVVGTVTAGAGRVVTPLSMTGIVVGTVLTAMNADASSPEVITVTAVTSATFTATFASNKAANWLIQAPLVFENGAIRTTFISGSPGAGTYGVVMGAGTDGVDQLKAGTAPASGVIVTVAAQCRRALRRAKFTADRNPFSMQVAGNYQQGSLTVQEVRK